MVLGKLPVPGRPTIWITVGQGPTALAVGAGGGCLDIFTLIYHFFTLSPSLFSPSLWEMARYRLKCCLKGLLNPKPTNIHSINYPFQSLHVSLNQSSLSQSFTHSSNGYNFIPRSMTEELAQTCNIGDAYEEMWF